MSVGDYNKGHPSLLHSSYVYALKTHKWKKNYSFDVHKNIKNSIPLHSVKHKYKLQIKIKFKK